jgi:hypothetical protein
VLALVDGEVLGNIISIGYVVVASTRGELLEANGIRAVTVNLVVAQVQKYCLG